MSLNYRQQNQLYRLGTGLRHSDPHLGAMLDMFGKLYPDQCMPVWEQVPQASASQDRIHRAAARLMATLIATAAAISALVITVGAATARWGIRDGDGQQDGERDEEWRHQGHTGDGLRRPDGLA
jgi:hypothetical protein